MFDNIHINRCSHCCGIGHSKKDCKKTDPICTFCSLAHPYEQCPNKDSKSSYKCHNCNLNKKFQSSAFSHHAFSNECPVYNQQIQQIISKTDFGIDKDKLSH